MKFVFSLSQVKLRNICLPLVIQTSTEYIIILIFSMLGFMNYTAKNAQITTGLLTSCNILNQQADVRMRSYEMTPETTKTTTKLISPALCA